jgi:hypothetical protein
MKMPFSLGVFLVSVTTPLGAAEWPSFNTVWITPSSF